MSAALDDRPADVLVEPTPVVTPGRALAIAIDELALGNHSLAHGLGEDRLPHTASLADGLNVYGGELGEWTPMYSLWLHWRNSERVREAFDAFRGVKPVTPLPAVAPPEPDEAPGLDVPSEPAGHAAAQQRLAGIG
jgi:hypothetical protein